MIEQEQYLLGTILSYPDAIKRIGDLKPSHMSQPLHEQILAAIYEQISSAQSVSPMSVASRVGKEHSKYIAQLSGHASNKGVEDISYIASMIIDAFHERRLKDLCEEGLNRANAGGKIQDLLPVMRKATDESLDAVGSRRQRTAKQVTLDILEDLKSDKVPHSTGLMKLDEAMGGGLYQGKAYGIAARKKVGKTIMLGTISHNLNKAGVPHLFICGEMGEKEIHQRVLCRELDLYTSAFRSGYAQRPTVMERMATYSRDMPNNTIYLDAPAVSFETLKQQVTLAHMKYGIKGFILDYWQLVTGKGKESEAYFLGEVAQWIAEIGRKLDIFSLTAAQINQEGNTRGGEGMRLAFDQVYQLHPMNNDVTIPNRWLEMMDTRYTGWMNIGSNDMAGYELMEKGLYFNEY